MSTKKPPPDTLGNVQGRIAALKTSVRQNAAMAAKEGDDYDKALAKGMRAADRELKKLEARLAKVKNTDKTSPVGNTRKLSSKPKSRATTSEPEKAPESPQEQPKKRSATRVPADYKDLLDTLNGL